jgi:hypothetical protein
MKNEHEEIVAAIATWGWKMTQNANRVTDTQPKISKWKENNLYMRRLV